MAPGRKHASFRHRSQSDNGVIIELTPLSVRGCISLRLLPCLGAAQRLPSWLQHASWAWREVPSCALWGVWTVGLRCCCAPSSLCRDLPAQGQWWDGLVTFSIGKRAGLFGSSRMGGPGSRSEWQPLTAGRGSAGVGCAFFCCLWMGGWAWKIPIFFPRVCRNFKRRSGVVWLASVLQLSGKNTR